MILFKRAFLEFHDQCVVSVAFELLNEYILCSKPDLLRCIRENLTAIRDDVNPNYADDIDHPQKVQNLNI